MCARARARVCVCVCVFDIVIYALNFKPSNASTMKFSQHFGRSLESIVNKLWQNVLSASLIVGICSNLVGYWSVELFPRRSTIPFTTFPELSTATKPLKEVRRLIIALEIGEDGTVDSFQAPSFCSLILTNFVFRHNKAANSVNNFVTTSFSMTISLKYLLRTMIEIVKPWWEIIFVKTLQDRYFDIFRYIIICLFFNTLENKKRGKEGRKLFCIFFRSIRNPSYFHFYRSYPLRDVLFLNDDKVKRPEQESRSSSSSQEMPKES